MSLISGTPAQALVELINAQNTLPTPLESNGLTFGTPKAATGGLVRVPSVAFYDGEYEGYATFQYRRINLGLVYGTVRPKIALLGQPTLHRLLPGLNQALGTTFTVDDVVDVQLAAVNGGEQVNVQITAKPDSLGYEGSLVVQYTRLRPQLSSVLPNKQLDVLKHPWIDPTKRSIELSTWGIDFTDHRDHLGLHYNYWWLEQAYVNQMMADLGFANWPGAILRRISKNLTKNIPTANQEFTYVILQEAVVGPDYAGLAYFHFN